MYVLLVCYTNFLGFSRLSAVLYQLDFAITDALLKTQKYKATQVISVKLDNGVI